MDPFSWLKQKVGDIGGAISTGVHDVENFFGGNQQPSAPKPAAPPPAAAPNPVRVAPTAQTPSVQVATPQFKPPTPTAPTAPAVPPVAQPVVSGVKTLSDTNDMLNNPNKNIYVHVQQPTPQSPSSPHPNNPPSNPLSVAGDFMKSLPESAKEFGQGVGQTLQSFVRGPIEAVRTIAGDEKPYTPKPGVEQVILGKEPLTNEQQNFVSSANAVGSAFGNPDLGNNLPEPLKIAGAGVMSALDMAPAAGIAKGVIGAVPRAAEAGAADLAGGYADRVAQAAKETGVQLPTTGSPNGAQLASNFNSPEDLVNNITMRTLQDQRGPNNVMPFDFATTRPTVAQAFENKSPEQLSQFGISPEESDAYDLLKSISPTPASNGAAPIADEQRIINQNINNPPEDVGKPGTRNLNAESAAIDEIRSGNNVQAAIGAYMREAKLPYTPENLQLSSRAVSRASKEAGFDLGANDPTQNPLFGTKSLPEAGDWRQAYLNGQTVAADETRVGIQARDAFDSLSPRDQLLMGEIEAKPINEVAATADNPQAFLQAQQSLKNYFDTRHAWDSYFGVDVGYRTNYIRHIFDQSGEDVPDRAAKASLNPGYKLSREDQNIVQNVRDSLSKDITQASSNHRALAVQKGLQEAHGDQISIGQPKMDENGRNFEQLDTFGNKGKNVFAHPDLAKEINARAPYEYSPGHMGAALRAFDSYNAFTKSADLALGGFHSMNEAATSIPISLMNGDFKAIADNIFSTVSPKYFNDTMLQRAANGTLHKANLAGLTFNGERAAGDAAREGKGIIIDRGKYNPIRAMHDSLFQRQIPEAKLSLFESETRNLDSSNPEDLRKMRDIANVINNAYGGINRAVAGITPKTAKQLSRLVLALDFNEGQARLMIDALTKGGVAGNLSRRILAGRLAALAVPLIVAQSFQEDFDKKSPSKWLQFITNEVMDPHLSVPFTTPGGIPKEVHLPGPAYVGSKIYKAVQPFFDENQPDKYVGIKHEVTGNLSSGLSSGIKLLTNQDYYGNPIITGNPGESAANVATQFTPIAVGQVEKALTGQESPAEAAINIAGGRTSANADDPRMVIMNYRSQLLGQQSKETQGLIYAIHPSWNPDLTSDPQKRQAAINAAYQSPQYETQKWEIMNSHPEVVAVEKQLDDENVKNGLPANPFFQLTPDQQKIVTEYESLNKSDPKASDTATLILQRNSDWMNNYFARASEYGQQMNSVYQQSGGTKGSNENTFQVGAVPYPKIDPSVQDLANQYFALTDPTQQSAFMKEHPDLGSKYFDVLFDYANAQRASMGLPLLKPHPTAPPEVQSFTDQYMAADTATRKGLRASNPDLYAKMTQYLADTDEYNLAKNVGLDRYQGQSLTQKDLKNIYSMGHYDIGKDANGNYAQMQNGQLPEGFSTGSGSSSKKMPFVPKPRRPRQRYTRLRKPYLKQGRTYVHVKHSGVKGAPGVTIRHGSGVLKREKIGS